MTIDYEYWKNLDCWTISEAIILCSGNDPRYIVQSNKPYFNPLLFDNLEQFLNRFINYIRNRQDLSEISTEGIDNLEQFFRSLLIFQRGIQAGTLKHINGTVNPSGFIEWVLSKGLKIPEELKSLAPSFIMKSDESREENNLPYMDTKNEYYAPELAIAVDAWKRIYSEPGAIQENRGYKDQISEWLENNHPDLSKDARARIATVINVGKRKKGGSPKIEPK